MKQIILYLPLVAVLATGCNKTKSFSNRLSGETWAVTKLTIDGEEEESDHFPTLEFADCDIYEEVCEGHWMLEGEEAHFAWQFDERGSLFTISNQSTAEHDHDHEHEDDAEHEHADPVDQCQDLSGTYDVEEMKRSTMTIKSTSTVGHEGEEVMLVLEKQ